MKSDNSVGRDAFIAWLPFLIAFAAVPLAILVPNLVEFDHDLTVGLPLLALALVALPALALALRLLGPTTRTAVSGGLFFLGLWLLLSDFLAPLEWGLLDGENRLKEPIGNTVKEALLAVVLAVLWLKLPPKPVRTFGVAVTAVILAGQIVLLALGGVRATDRSGPGEAAAPAVSPLKPAGGAMTGNVYHLVFDGYSSASFGAAVDELQLAETLQGFTFFDRVLANYHVTDASVPSFLLGRFYRGGSFSDWQSRAMTDGLRRWHADAGFEIEVFSPDRARFWMYDGASVVHTGQEIARSYFRGSDTLRLAQVTAVRVAPNILRHETLAVSERLFGHLIARINGTRNAGTFSRYALYKQLSVPLFRRFLEDEASRPAAGRYVYVHVILPHAPFVWNEECVYDDPSTFEAQTLCATRLLAETVDTLQRLGRYRDALVIVQSDHGYHGEAGGETALDIPPPPAIRERVEATMTYIDTDGYFRRIQPLLAIKPPASDRSPLRVSSAPAQLIDLPATVVDLTGVDAPPTDGTSVFGLPEEQPREIHLYAGVYTKDPQGRVLVLGQTMSATELAHISYTAGEGWKAYPNQRARTD